MLFIFKSKGVVIIFQHSHGECRWNQIRHAVRSRHYDIAAAGEMGLGAKMLIQDNLSLAHLMGQIKDHYLQYEKAGHQYIGQISSGLVM